MFQWRRGGDWRGWLVVYTSLLFLFCFLITSTEAERNLKKPKDIGNDSGERSGRYKEEKKYKGYKYKNDNNNNGKEEYKINRYNRQKCKGKNCEKSETREYDDGADFFKAERYSKYSKKFNKYKDDSEEEPVYKKRKVVETSRNRKRDLGNEKNYEYKKSLKRSVIEEEREEDTEEEIIGEKEKIKKRGTNAEKKLIRTFDRKREDPNSRGNSDRNQDGKNRKWRRNEDEDSEEDNSDEVIKFKTTVKDGRASEKLTDIDSDEEFQDTPRGRIKKRMETLRTTVSDRDSNGKRLPEENSDDSSEASESDEEIPKTCKKRSATRSCVDRNFGIDEDSVGSDGTSNESDRKRKIKYSIKFAHEKQKNVPNEEDNIMKIHRDKKKYKYQDDDDEDDSSEEHDHPKRIRYLDEDEE